MKSKIKFGTDGWRGLMSEDFTFENVALVATAVARVLQKEKKGSKILVGYDRRANSPEYANLVSTIYAQHGFDVMLTQTYVPTPILSWTVKNTPNCAGGTMITASHNSYEWNGFKFKESFGGSASNQVTDTFENEIAVLQKTSIPQPNLGTFEELKKQKKILMFSPTENYVTALLQQVDANLIRKKKFRVGVDAMYGAGSAYFKRILEKLDVEVTEIHGEHDIRFGGTPPEPVEKNISELMGMVCSQKLDCGLATDGDADRLGAVDEFGNSFTTQKILSVVYWHMLENKKKSWSIARSVSTTNMVDRIAESKGLKCFETPVGFKNIAQEILAGKAQIGGEESGGIGIVDHVIERDSFITGLLLLEIMAVTGKKLSEIYAEICKTFRPCEFIRLDLNVSADTMKNALEKLSKAAPKEWLGRKVQRVQNIDGHKFYLEDGSWILIRPSGTEPIFRLYAESESLEVCKKLLASIQAFVES